MRSESPDLTALTITTLQLGAGSLLCPLCWLLRGVAPSFSPRLGLLAACHAAAGLLTNLSMATTTAQLTHLVKMSEPLYTLLILVTLGKAINTNIPHRHVQSTFLWILIGWSRFYSAGGWWRCWS